MVLKDLLTHYPHESLEEKENALKEVIQEIALLGLLRTDFFSRAAFYGGTCLRLFYDLPRFSEDLDFALFSPSPSFELTTYFPEMERTFSSYGFRIEFGSKAAIPEGDIRSAFIKGGTLSHLVNVFPNSPEVKRIISNQMTKVKFEVDINPAPNASYEQKLSLFPSAYYLQAFDGPSLFAGKVHAVICHARKSRTKGRDLYDYLFYLQKGIPLSLPYLKSKLVQSKKLSSDVFFGKKEAITFLQNRFEEIDFASAKKDVLPFIVDKEEVNLWDKKLFIDSLTMLKTRG